MTKQMNSVDESMPTASSTLRLWVRLILIGPIMFASSQTFADIFSITSTDDEILGGTVGDLSRAINLANGGAENSIIFNINEAVNYSQGTMPVITQSMTIDGNGQNALRLQTTPHTTPLFTVTSAEERVLTLRNMLSDLPVLQAPLAVGMDAKISFVQTIAGNYSYGTGITAESAITGAGSVSFLGGADVNIILTRPSSYSGGTSLLDGSLTLGHAAAIGTGTLTLGGGTLQANGPLSIDNTFSLTGPAAVGGTNNLSINGTGALGGNALTISNTQGTIQLDGVISGLGTSRIIQDGEDGTFIISRANTFTGGMTLNNGTAVVEDDAAFGIGPLALEGGFLQSSAAVTLGNAFTVGVGAPTINGVQDLTLSGNGVLSGALSITNTGLTTLSGTLSEAVEGGGSLIADMGVGSLLISGNNTFTGGMTLTSGTLIAGHTTAFGTGPLVLEGGFLHATAALTLGNAFTVDAVGLTIDDAQDLTLSGNGVLNSELTVTNTGLTTLSGTLSEAVVGGGSLLADIGVGSLLVSGNNNTFSGGTTLTSGTLIVGNHNAFGTGALALNGGFLQSNAAFSIPNNFTLGVLGSTINGATDLTLSGNGVLSGLLTISNTAFITFSGTLSETAVGAGSITANMGAGGSVLLSGNNNTFSGPFTLTSGTITVGNNTALGTGALALEGGFLQSTAAFSIPNNFTVGVLGSTINGATDLTLSGNGVLSGDLTVTNTAFTTLSGNLSGPCAIIANMGAGSLLLSGNNTYSGGTTFTSGTVIVGSNTALGTAALAFNGGSLQSNGAFTIDNNFTVAAGGFTISGANDLSLTHDAALMGVLRVTNTALTTLSGNLSNAGSILADMGAGSLLVSGNNIFTGGATLTSGSIIVGNNAAFGTGPFALDGGFLQSNGVVTIGNAFTVGAGGSTINGDQDLTLSGNGVLSGAFSITNTGLTTLNGDLSEAGAGGSLVADMGAGRLLVSGNNTFSLGMTLTSGTITVGSHTAVGAGALALNGGFLQSSGAFTLGNAFTVEAAGVTLDGTNALTLSGNGILSSGLTVTNTNLTTLSGTLSEVVGGPGSLVADMGAGSLLVSGNNNTFSGGTTLSSGTLFSNSDNALGIGALALNGGTLLQTAGGAIVLGNSSFTVGALGSTLGGANDLRLTGCGTLYGPLTITNTGVTTLSGNIKGAGLLTVSNGTLILSGNTLQTNILNNSMVLFNQNSNAIYSGSMPGLGGVVMGGTGKVTFIGTNTYTGGTQINAGTLEGNSVSLPGNITNHSNLVFNQVSDGTYTGTMTGNGTLTKIGSGNLMINSNQPAFLGATHINAGRLSVNNQFGGPIFVNPGATLGGTGFVTNAVINNGGTISPGNSTAALTVNQVVKSPTANFNIELNPAGQSSRLHVQGVPATADIAGTLRLFPEPGHYQEETSYTILTATNGVTGSFSNVKISNALGGNLGTLRPKLFYHANSITFTLEHLLMLPQAMAGGGNQTALNVATVLDDILNTPSLLYTPMVNDLMQPLANLSTPEETVSALNQLTQNRNSAIQAGVVEVSLRAVDSLQKLASYLQNHKLFNRGKKVSTSSDRVPTGISAGDELNSMLSYGTAFFGSYEKQDARMKADYPFTNVTGGAGVLMQYTPMDLYALSGGLSYANIKNKTNNMDAHRFDRADVNSYQATIINSYSPGTYYFELAVSYARNNVHQTNNIVFEGVNLLMSSKYHINQTGAQLSASKGFLVPGVDVLLSPKLSATWNHLYQPAYQNNPSPAAKSLASMRVNSVLTGFGVSLCKEQSLVNDKILARYEIHGIKYHELIRKNLKQTAQFLGGGAPFIIETLKPYANTFNVGCGVSLAYNDHFILTTAYDAHFKKRYRNHAVMMQWLWHF